VIEILGQVPYQPTYAAMQTFTADRSAETPDALWLCEHPPVFTLGLASRAEHLLATGDIEVVATNRGGQVTYHGPGQVVAYPLLDLRRRGYFVKEYVYRLEEAVIRTLLAFGITGHRVGGAPGIYVRLDDPRSHAVLEQRPQKVEASVSLEDSSIERTQAKHSKSTTPDFTGLGKIAALGIKVSRHCTYHGVALNVAMDLSPFSRIDPCGYPLLKTVDLSTIGVSVSWQEAADVLGQKLTTYLSP
jgi:lipoyl(octanoyl) transferase